MRWRRGAEHATLRQALGRPRRARPLCSSGVTVARSDRGRARRHRDYAGRNGRGVATAFQGDGSELRSNIGEAVGSIRDARSAREMGRPAGSASDRGYAEQRRGRRPGSSRVASMSTSATPSSQRRRRRRPSRERRKLALGGRTPADARKARRVLHERPTVLTTLCPWTRRCPWIARRALSECVHAFQMACAAQRKAVASSELGARPLAK